LLTDGDQVPDVSVPLGAVALCSSSARLPEWLIILAPTFHFFFILVMRNSILLWTTFERLLRGDKMKRGRSVKKLISRRRVGRR
jgi:hypothetical protein